MSVTTDYESEASRSVPSVYSYESDIGSANADLDGYDLGTPAAGTPPTAYKPKPYRTAPTPPPLYPRPKRASPPKGRKPCRKGLVRRPDRRGHMRCQKPLKLK